MTDRTEFESECRILIATAEACWRPVEPSYSWHVLDWICYRQRLKYPLVRDCDRIVSMATIC